MNKKMKTGHHAVEDGVIPSTVIEYKGIPRVTKKQTVTTEETLA
jgi:hypothetical protein